jgi:hypothetical protein
VTLYGTNGASHLQRDLGFAEVTEVPQHDCLALASGQAAKGDHEVASFAEVGIDQADRTGHRRGGAPAAAVAVDGQVRGDAGHPSLGSVLEAGPTGDGPSQRLLRNILGIPLIAQNPIGHAVSQAIQVLEGQVKAVW